MTHPDLDTRSETTDPLPGQFDCPEARPAARWITEEARLLAAAQRDRRAVTPSAARHPRLTLADAYRVQAAGIELRVAGGARPVGHKVGLTSQAMQAQMGVAEPDSGVLLDRMVLPDGGELDVGEFLAPRVEAEIAFRLGEDLCGGVDTATARGAVAQVLLALEVIDTRFGSWRIGLVDSVADNASCARVVLGEAVAPSEFELADAQIVLDVDGVPTAAGAGRAVLGDPLAALVWLARRLEEFGGGLRAGDLVLAGAVHASVELRAGTEVRAHCPHLPAVHLRVR
ncbi:fumarylacetoacetate hydrolase family protein [Saccharothrix sp.]|uniref:2-keto-4-pentenoate hydratase n=1 Tax=Saccharothrix sp. TaxID=1873460 RepID=UPI002810D49A|nr:fumarylacetoacetate hydrolase family protein [Saccharothrix sp.]